MPGNGRPRKKSASRRGKAGKNGGKGQPGPGCGETPGRRCERSVPLEHGLSPSGVAELLKQTLEWHGAVSCHWVVRQ